jgi:Glycosyl hydrolases family 38 C-terminal domain/Glycosyl hydrolases family 38 C-terminal beta sandwich domain
VPTSTGLEVHVQFEQPWVQQVTRVTDGLPYVEIEYTVGPIPVDDKRGKEVVTRFVTPMKTDSIFYTDSNGREFQKRQRNFRPTWALHMFEPVAGNYYPVNAAMFMADQSTSFSVMVDRTQGGGSIFDGSVELMAHRRLLADDSRGVGEPMNETDGGVTPYPPFGKNTRWGEGLVIRGTYRILVGNGTSGASLARSVMDGAFAPPLVFVASAKSNEQVPLSRTSFSALKAALPSNVMLVTFKRLHGNVNNTSQYMIRLGHQFSVNEDEELSKSVTIDLANLFTGFKLTAAKEMTLSANQAYNEWVKTRLQWTGSSSQPSAVSYGNTSVTLYPMDVRTFVVSLEEASS